MMDVKLNEWLKQKNFAQTGMPRIGFFWWEKENGDKANCR